MVPVIRAWLLWPLPYWEVHSCLVMRVSGTGDAFWQLLCPLILPALSSALWGWIGPPRNSDDVPFSVERSPWVTGPLSSVPAVGAAWLLQLGLASLCRGWWPRNWLLVGLEALRVTLAGPVHRRGQR